MKDEAIPDPKYNQQFICTIIETDVTYAQKTA